ncbi:hypothetical protein [Nostoc sp. NMS4]|nr:hypothetical protein [Nostoc sp. NMS4]
MSNRLVQHHITLSLRFEQAMSTTGYDARGLANASLSASPK